MQVKEINVEQLKEKQEKQDDIFLYDIRSEGEVAHGIISNAIYLPMHLIPLKLTEFPKDKEIILYCRSGVRSYNACQYLMQAGFNNVFNLQGGIISWARQGYDIIPLKRQ